MFHKSVWNFVTGGGGSPDIGDFVGTGGYQNPGFPTPFESDLSVGDVKTFVKDRGGKVLGDLLQLGIDGLTSYIMGGVKDPGGQEMTIAVQPGNIVGLGGLLAFMKRQPPPANGKKRKDRGNWIRDAASAVLGIPKEVVWRNEAAKRNTYELFRSYLAAFDAATDNQYRFAATIGPRQGTLSDSEYAFPADLERKLRSIGVAGLTAIDAMWNGQTLDPSTVEYIEGKATTSSDKSALDKFLDILKGAFGDAIAAGGTVLTATAEGAAAGAGASARGARTGAAAGRATLFGVPFGVLVFALGAMLVVFFFVRRR